MFLHSNVRLNVSAVQVWGRLVRRFIEYITLDFGNLEIDVLELRKVDCKLKCPVAE